jgi:hypothetical protein
MGWVFAQLLLILWHLLDHLRQVTHWLLVSLWHTLWLDEFFQILCYVPIQKKNMHGEDNNKYYYKQEHTFQPQPSLQDSTTFVHSLALNHLFSLLWLHNNNIFNKHMLFSLMVKPPSAPSDRLAQLYHPFLSPSMICRSMVVIFKTAYKQDICWDQAYTYHLYCHPITEAKQWHISSLLSSHHRSKTVTKAWIPTFIFITHRKDKQYIWMHNPQ